MTRIPPRSHLLRLSSNRDLRSPSRLHPSFLKGRGTTFRQPTPHLLHLVVPLAQRMAHSFSKDVGKACLHPTSLPRRCSRVGHLLAHSSGLSCNLSPSRLATMLMRTPSDTYSNVLRAPLPARADLDDLPFSFSSSKSDEMLSNPEPNGDLNRFRVRAGQSLQEWEKAGWIWSDDPRGWAQWYVRFWAGRRCADDERQIRRCGHFLFQPIQLFPDACICKGLKVAGATGRFKRALLKVVHRNGGEEALCDEDVGRVLRQCLWQWGYELNEVEYRRAMAGNG